MIIIGLAGGKPCNREEIAVRLERFGGQRMKSWAGSDSKNTAVRARDLSLALNDARRNKALGGVIVTHVMTKAEADDIRQRGGEVWHVMGPVSESVPIEQYDPKVTHMHGGCRHFQDSMEAFSEHLMKIAAAH